MYLVHHFEAFDTIVDICVVGKRKNELEHLRFLENDARNFELSFSRFIPGSELSRLNNSGGSTIQLSEDMYRLLQSAQKAYKYTEFLFDPTILISLQQLGYSNTGQTEPDKENLPLNIIKIKFLKRTPFQNLKISGTKRTAKIPKNLKIDLGGIAKGYWVDKSAKFLSDHFSNFWISAGGDTYVKGYNENFEKWHVEIQNPIHLQKNIFLLKVPSHGIALATSGITKRHGITKNFHWHHIINPLTGLPVRNSILSVTVLAKSVMKADVLAKVTLIKGLVNGMDLINKQKDCHCIIIDKHMRTHFSKGISNYMEKAKLL